MTQSTFSNCPHIFTLFTMLTNPISEKMPKLN